MIDLTLSTMTCGHCVKTVTATVQRVDPGARLQIDLATHRVQIETQAEEKAVREALAEEGYAAA